MLCSEFGAACGEELRQRFFQQVTVLRSDLSKWASKQSKQVGGCLWECVWQLVVCVASGRTRDSGRPGASQEHPSPDVQLDALSSHSPELEHAL